MPERGRTDKGLRGIAPTRAVAARSVTGRRPIQEGAMAKDAIELLTDDHEQVKAMFEEFDDLAGDDSRDDEKRALVQQICRALEIHERIEEEIFYPAAREALEDDDLVDEAVVEPPRIKDLVEELKAMDPLDDMYDAKVKVLVEYVEHHVQEEESELFPQLKKADLDLDELGAQLADLKEEMMPMMGAMGRKGDADRPTAGR
jgi:hemerythrin superfamily protein